MKINNNHILPCVNFMRLIFQLKTTPNACPLLTAVANVINRNQLHVFGEAFFGISDIDRSHIWASNMANKWMRSRKNGFCEKNRRRIVFASSVRFGGRSSLDVCKNQTLKMEKKQKPNKMWLLLFLLLRILTMTGWLGVVQPKLSSFFTWSEKNVRLETKICFFVLHAKWSLEFSTCVWSRDRRVDYVRRIWFPLASSAMSAWQSSSSSSTGESWRHPSRRHTAYNATYKSRNLFACTEG